MTTQHVLRRIAAVAVVLLSHVQLISGYEIAYVLHKNENSHQYNSYGFNEANIFDADEFYHSDCGAPQTTTINRKSPGLYSVRVGQDMAGTADSNVQVTTLDDSFGGFCNVVNWQEDYVQIQCRTMFGEPADQAFSVLVIQTDEPSDVGKLAFTWIHNATGEESPPPPSVSSASPLTHYSFGFTRHDDGTSSRRVELGRYQVRVGKQIDPNDSAVFVTPYESGSPTTSTAQASGYCNIESWNEVEADEADSLLTIACFDPYGIPMDSRVSLLILSAEMDGVNLKRNIESQNATEGILQIDSGLYDVYMGPDFSSRNDHTQVTAHGSDARCFATKWIDYDCSTIPVNCYDPQGDSVDSEFIVATFNPRQAIVSLQTSSPCYVDSETTVMDTRNQDKDEQRDFRGIPVGFAVPAIIMGLVFCCFKIGSARVGAAQNGTENGNAAHGDPLRDYRPQSLDVKTLLKSTTMTIKKADLVWEDKSLRDGQQEPDIEVSSSSSVGTSPDLENPKFSSLEIYSNSQRSANLGYNMLKIPSPPEGMKVKKGTKSTKALKTMDGPLVPSTCAICLCSYRVQEQVSWSQNPRCPHAFHLKCLDSMGRHSSNNAGGGNGGCLHCPLCRRNFISPQDEN